MKDRITQLARDYWIDVAALVFIGEAVYEGLFGVSDTRSWAVAVFSGLAPLGLVARRWFPLAAPLGSVVLLLIGVAVAPDAMEAASAPFFTLILVAGVIGAYNEFRHALAGLAVISGAVILVNQRFRDQGVGDYIFPLLTFAASWGIGLLLNARARNVRELKERAARLEREREEKARTAVAEERARIARELHDVVGHSVSVMTVQAAAVRRLLRPEQEKEREALLTVEQTGREALAEMRKMVGVLRRPEEAPALAPQPTLVQLGRLVEQAKEAGLPVDLRIEGEAAQLPPSVDLAAYRLVQEGLTNAIKHAKASRAEVVVRYGGDEVELVITDDGRGTGSGDGSGHGLVGIRERISVVGGQLEAGPRPEGGFRLHARLPTAAA